MFVIMRLKLNEMETAFVQLFPHLYKIKFGERLNMGITVAQNGFPQVCSADSEGCDFPSWKDGPPCIFIVKRFSSSLIYPYVVII